MSEVSFPGFWELLAKVGKAPPPYRAPGSGGGAAGAGGRGRAAAGCMVVAIDGSAGSGKSTTAASVAARLGFRHLDSGAIYRAVTLGLLDAGLGGAAAGEVTPDQPAALDIDVRWSGGEMEVWMGGAAVPEEALRAERVTAMVSQVSAVRSVRAHLLALQRSAATGPGVVAEGRDMGTVVFPEAGVKVHLDADPGERARRRILQRDGRVPDDDEIEAEANRLTQRDARDSSRAIAPLLIADDAVQLDTTDLSPAAQTEAIVRLVRAALADIRDLP